MSQPIEKQILTNQSSKVLTFFLAFVLACPTLAYDSPLSAESIRDAYSIGQRHDAQFLAQYQRNIPTLEVKESMCVSSVRLETPFLQIVNFANEEPNYSAQDAVKQFYGRPLPFRIFLDICYMPAAPPPGALKIKLIQNKKMLIPTIEKRDFYIPVGGDYQTLASDGERIQLEFSADQISSLTLTLQVDTPDKQHAEIELDLSTLR